MRKGDIWDVNTRVEDGVICVYVCLCVCVCDPRIGCMMWCGLSNGDRSSDSIMTSVVFCLLLC